MRLEARDDIQGLGFLTSQEITRILLPQNRWFAKISWFWCVTDPIWVTIAATIVCLAGPLQMNPLFTWAALVIAASPFLYRLLYYGYAAVRTQFDIPIILFVAGAWIGFETSPYPVISLGALQTLVAITLWYYSTANYRYHTALVKCIWPIAVVGVALVTLLALRHIGPSSEAVKWCSAWAFELTGFLVLPDFLRSFIGPNISLELKHGMALVLCVLGLVGTGMMVFSKSIWLRLAAAVSSLVCLGVGVLFIKEALLRLFNLSSIEARMPLWDNTINLLRESPLVGLGLGCWGPILGGATTPPFTHPHNAYLEVFANFGILGAVALVISLVLGIKIMWEIVRAPRNNNWYGFGIGLVLAAIAIVIVAMVESSPIGIPIEGPEDYFYLVSPLPWVMAALLVIVHKLLYKQDADTEKRTS